VEAVFSAMAPIILAGTAIDTPRLIAELGALVGAGATLVECDVGALATRDVRAVDALARLQLTARRLGCRLRLRRAPVDLLQLLGCLGLADAVLGVEVGRQAEDREQPLRVEEERELDDPVA
jgi:hypothetical protein